MNRQNQGIVSFNGLINDLLSGNGPRIFGESVLPSEWTKHGSVPVNLIEKNEGFHMDIVAPGISKEDIKLDVAENVLSVSFEAKKEETADNEANDGKVLKNEYQVRSFKRSFKLGNKVDIDKISAKYENGILSLALPKKEVVIASNKSIAID